MRKVNKLIYKSVFPPFLIALTVLTFVVSVHDLSSLSELLITRNASLGVVLYIAGTLLPNILIFSLPLSYLIGILIGITGLSGETQITALRACGIPIKALLQPLLQIGLPIGIITGFLALFVLPNTNDMQRQIKDKIGMAQVTSQIQPRVFNEDMPKIVFYIDDLELDKQHWSKVFLADNTNPQNPKIMMSKSGAWVTDQSKRRLQLHLEQGVSYSTTPNDPSKDIVSSFIITDIPIEIEKDAMPDQRQKKVIELSSTYLLKSYRNSSPEKRIEQILELNRRIALPFAIIPFALLGLTLAVSAPKGGRASGFALSLAVVVAFYVLLSNGLRLASVGKISPWLGAWGANIILITLGLLLLVKVEQGSRTSGWFGRLRLWKHKPHSPSAFFPAFSLRTKMHQIAIFRPIERIIKILFPKILDLYISKGFFVYFFWSIISCGTLFIILTLFDLLDDIIRNHIPLSLIVGYFIFLLPQILMIVVPMSALLAVLINFSILEKNSEITSIKAGGWSLYRIAAPITVIAIGLCLGMFLMQDYVLPDANYRQDNIRNVIKGRPMQSTRHAYRKWIFGESGRIYNYEYFDGNQDSFVDLNVYEVDMSNSKILRSIHAAKATIDRNNQWTLEDGWIRDYGSTQMGFKLIKKASINFPEAARYFTEEIFQPKESSKLTYLELKDYINYLMKAGYNSVELKIELYKKISFPLSCLVMTLLGIPFSFSMGKKGAFFGIGISIAIAISYWGISGIFEAMGAYGLLAPMLSAWAPTVLFSATGLALLFTIRT